MVAESLLAADLLANRGIDVMVIDMYSIKPIDRELLVHAAKRTGLVITAENHNVIGGLGSAAAEILAETFPIPVYRIGVREQFWPSGQNGLFERILRPDRKTHRGNGTRTNEQEKRIGLQNR